MFSRKNSTTDDCSFIRLIPSNAHGKHRRVTDGWHRSNEELQALVFAIYNLCMHPEYIAPLRQEMERVLQDASEEERFKDMPLLDSFLRESARLNPLDGSIITLALKKLSRKAKTWTQIDIDAAAQLRGVQRADAVRRLQEWNDSGAIERRRQSFSHIQRFPPR